MLILAADAAAQPAGWAHLVALLLAGAAIYTAIDVHRWWLDRRDAQDSPPPLLGEDDEEEFPQVDDGASEDGTDPEVDVDLDDKPQEQTWWGERVTLPDGSRVVKRPIWHRREERGTDADQDFGTDGTADSEVDVDLGVRSDNESLSDAAARMRASGVRFSVAIPKLTETFGVSRRSAARAWKNAL